MANILSAAYNQAKAINPIANAAYALSGGKVGTDITPSYSVNNVISTQASKLLGNNGAAPAGNVQGGTNVVPADGGNGGNGSGAYNEADNGGMSAADRDAALYGVETGISNANSGLGRLGNQEQIGMGNIDREYQDAISRLTGKQQMADANFNQNTTEQLNRYTSARNKSATVARNFMDTARRTLGANGAGSGSAARYGVPNEANMMAASGNADAQATNNKNIISLTQGYNADKDSITNGRNDVIRQRDQGINDLKSKIEGSRAQLINTIAQLTGQRVLANGGNYKAAAAASGQYNGQINGILGNIDNLSATPNIAEQAITLSRPDLSEYSYATPGAEVLPTQDPTLAGGSPVLSSLFDPEQQRRLAYA